MWVLALSARLPDFTPIVEAIATQRDTTEAFASQEPVRMTAWLLLLSK
jgi:hypothetical protein